jgi:two-component system LytT family response regulator
MRTLVVDNEADIRRSVVDLISAFCPDITEIVEANSVNSGIAKILSYKPDVVFLDVELGDGTAMDLLSKLDKIDFHLIFITAHNKYAIDAFRFSAIDFLLKPINPEELMLTIEKIKKHNNLRLNEQIEILKEVITTTNQAEKKIVLRDNESIFFVKVSDIIRCESDKSYTKFILQNQKPIIVSKGLKEYEEMLEKFGFVRTHQSHLINMSKIIRFDKADGGSIVLENNDVVPVSQRKKEFILETFKNL